MNKTETLSVRVNAKLLKRFSDAAETAGIDRALMVRQAVTAICAYIEKHGEITMPFEMVPRKAAHAPPEKD